MDEIEINVLDHGFVRLVDTMGSDVSIARAARVSYAADWRVATETNKGDEGLIGYLLRNKHTSPFESVIFTFEIKCPIFVARQWHRHRTWSYNEVSARYTELPDEYYIPKSGDITLQSIKDKQQRTNEEHTLSTKFRNMMIENNAHAFIIYKSLLSEGCPRELARSVLPLGTYTRFFGTVDLHNLLHFLNLRLHAHAQYEIRVYAEAIMKLIESVVPVTLKHWKEINHG